jgi:starch phosphorylase
LKLKRVDDPKSIVPALGLDPDPIREGMLHELEFTLAELPDQVDSDWEPYYALALTLRERLLERWIKTQEAYYAADAKRVYYMSLEFLMGRTMGNSMINLGALEQCAKATRDLGLELEELRNAEWDAGLGNGGLGRLAACYLDSLATLGMPAYGYGIRYDYGIFHQRIVDGWQVEVPDAWLRYGNPWEVARPLDRMRVQFHGRVNQFNDVKGRLTTQWVETEDVFAVPYDTPIPGYLNGIANTLRLWGARATDEFDFRHFNTGDYVGAVQEKDLSENISKVLYPNDNITAGKELRLKQEYFFVAATLQDIIRRYKKQYRMYDQAKGLKTFDRFPDRVAIQLNDTHPTFAVPELMRLFIDIEELGWDEAWEITTKVFGYTNHTVLPEALERWPVGLVQWVLPRHLQIIYEINQRFLNKVRERFGDESRFGRMSIIEEGTEKRVRMANLAIVGSHSVNGVAQLHSDILKNELFPDFAQLWPDKFNNKTNGVTQRRWLLKSNPPLANIITDAIGNDWITDLYALKKLEPLANNPGFCEQWRGAKKSGKERLAEVIFQQYEKRGAPLRVDSNTMFDCQVKRMHEYKRQLLNLLGVITHYNRIKDGNAGHVSPRTVIFGGKAAPGYFMAKLIIRLINAVADEINNDKSMNEVLKVVFLADYRVSLAERIFPASDLSEQISTAGTEASGTGNMKFALNGALTIGTMDGANIEIREEVGDDNIFIFGLTAGQVNALKPHYNPWDFYNRNSELRRTLDMIGNGTFSPRDRGLFRPIVDSLLQGGDRYLLLADFESYVNCQRTVGQAYQDTNRWTRMSILNVARMGKFSSDRSIKQYCDEIWKVKPVHP